MMVPTYLFSLMMKIASGGWQRKEGLKEKNAEKGNGKPLWYCCQENCMSLFMKLPGVRLVSKETYKLFIDATENLAKI